MDVVKRLHRETAAVVRNPSLLRYAANSQARKRLMHRLTVQHPGSWDSSGDVAVRRYATYDDYLAHQRSKLATLDLTSYDQLFRAALAERVGAMNWAGRTVLCLAARLGTEVKAFHDVGAFAVGVDLNPGPDNTLVLPGDFHHLQFPDLSVDGVYCNSLDHALELRTVISEIRRVLKREGRAVIELMRATEDLDQNSWESTAWQSTDDVIAMFVEAGFVVESRVRVDVPSAIKEQVVLALSKEPQPGATD